MKKILLIIIILITSLRPCIALEPFKIAVVKNWTVDIAREEAFRDAKKQIDISEYESIDPNLIENKEAINKKLKKIADRHITYFSNGRYAITYIAVDMFDKGLIYTSEGKLISITYDIYPVKVRSLDEIPKLINNNKVFPYKTYSYNYPTGELDFIAITVSLKNSYIFASNGSLNLHWVGNKGYDADGKLRITRK